MSRSLDILISDELFERAASQLSSKAAVRRLVAATLAGLKPA